MKDTIDSVHVELDGKPVVGLYLFLRRHEEELDPATLSVLNTLERTLFRYLSIDEMEGLDDAYRGGADAP